MEEPRRSQRANKGSNSDRWQEVLDSARHNFESPNSVAGDTATDAGTIPIETQVGDDDEDRIRCVCGQTEEVEDEDKDFVQCDQCHVWQHNQCVGLPSEIPESQDYFCELCRPDLHQDLISTLSNGKLAKKAKSAKPKAERKRKRTAVDLAKSNVPLISDDSSDDLTSTHGKRQRSISLSDISVVTDSSDVILARARAGKDQVRKQSDAKSRSTKSRAVQPAAEKEPIKASKQSRVKSVPKTDTYESAVSWNGPYNSIDDIRDAERKKIATALIRLFGDSLTIATEKEGFILDDNTTAESTARILGLSTEFAMYEAQLDVKAKFRQLSFNLKDPKNPSLRQRVLDGTLPVSELVQMNSEDMANPELKAKTEALREESLEQSVLVQETGPRIRRTHKGEEYVEGPEAVSENMVIENAPKRHQVREESNSPMSIKSPSPSESLASDGSDSPEPVRRERSNSNFDIKDVWSHIESPTASISPFQRHGSTDSQSKLNTNVSREDDNDEEILGLLEDATAEPDRYDYTIKTAIWHGQLLMPGISELRAKGILLGGSKTFDINWTEALTDTIQIDGRIGRPDATKYLCHQKYSQSKSVFALQLQATEGKESALKVLYDYFIAKDRYGVIKPGKTRIRDAYIVPLPKHADLPEFITMLPAHEMPHDRTDMLLALLVVEKTASTLPMLDVQTTAPVITTSINVPQTGPKQITNQPQQVQSIPQTIQRASYNAPMSQAAPQAVSRPQQLLPQQQQQPQQQQHRWQATSMHHYPNQQTPPPGSFQYQQQQQNHSMPYDQDDPYGRQRQMNVASMGHNPMPPQLDQNAQAVLVAFLRAHPEIASNTQIISSPQLMARLLDEFVRQGGMMRQ